MSKQIHLLREDLIALVSDHYDVAPEAVDIRITLRGDDPELEIFVTGQTQKKAPERPPVQKCIWCGRNPYT